MLDKKDLESIRVVFREELRSDGTREFIQEVVVDALEQVVFPRFVALEDRMDQTDGRLDKIDGRLDHVDGRLDHMDSSLGRIESTMVTKDHLEDRLVDFKATLKQTGGQALRQIKTLAAELHRNGVFSAEQAVQVTSA